MIHSFRRHPKIEFCFYFASSLCVLAALGIGAVILPQLGIVRISLAKNLQRLESTFNLPSRSGIVFDTSKNYPVFEASTNNAVAVLSDLHARASHGGVAIDSVVSSQSKSIPDANMENAQFIVSARGPYVALKNVISEFFAANPAVALESVTVRRVRSTDVATDIEMRLNYIYRSDAIGPSNNAQVARN